MRRFLDLPIKHKLTLLTLLISGVALLLGCGTFAIITDMLDDNVAPGLAFNDAAAMDQTLLALKAHPHIMAACVYDQAGQIAASYQRPDQKGRFPLPAREHTGQHFAADRLDTFKDIALAGENIGVVYIGSDLTELTARAWRYAAIVGCLIVICSALALLLATRLQKIISEPIVELAQIAATVAGKKTTPFARASAAMMRLAG